MKIAVDLLQSTGTKGGIESYIRELYSEFALHSTGHEFVGFLPAEAEPSSFKWFPGELFTSKFSGENRAVWALGEMFGVANFAKSIGADLIHAPAMLGPASSVVPVVLTIHDLSYFTHPHLMRNKLLSPGVKAMEKLAARNAKSLIAISESTAKLIPIYLGTESSSKITTVLSAGAVVSPCGTSTTMGAEKPTFIAMGQRSPYKSLETAVIAMSLIPKNDRPKLVITGSHGNDPLAPLVQDLDLQHDVELLGWISDEELRRLMCSSLALIETTVAAGFGMPAVEALTMGVPVIASDIPVFREILADAAIYFEAGNGADLATKMVLAMNDGSQISRLKKAGPEQASNYSWDTTAHNTLKVFENAVL